ncbi:receptor-like protein 6 [Amaranthus tricolor]|uniref:receptor-like protein 6 n=1 Tax=Amaranthus tricolor TaxID=29722 RepID=UPI00258B7787|nr:receptor-like protein 6 [Amaranthus tricolor]
MSKYNVLLLSTFCFVIYYLLVLTYSYPTPLRPLCHHQEKLALLHFKQSFLIDCSASSSSNSLTSTYTQVTRILVENTTLSYNDRFPNGSIRVDNDCCMWDYVKCDEKTGHVIGLNLRNSCLYGTFPRNSTLFSLIHLRELDLSYNHFNYSRIPSTINREIPIEISTLSNLSLLDLSNNFALELQNDHGFDKLVGNLTRLTRLHLDHVDMSSALLLSLSNLTSLKTLSLSHCNLYGEFPRGVFLLPYLEELNLPANLNLGGLLPEFPINSPLKILNLRETSFSGEITTSIGNLGNLVKLNLYDTSFAGSVPSSLGNLTKLTELDLLCNFDGEFPLSITNLTQLTTLSLYDLRIGSEIMNSWLMTLSKLEQLTLSNINLSGAMPPALANLTRLTQLHLSSNQLTGPLPLWLTNLIKLQWLGLYGNQFQDPIIPDWFSRLISLETLIMPYGLGAMLDTLLKLPSLSSLVLEGGNLITSPNLSRNSSYAKFVTLRLMSCNLTEFPPFLNHQDELQMLDLKGNHITGNIPQWFVNTTAESLVEIDLDNNTLTGFEEPQNFLPWNNLQALYIQNNKLQGQVLTPPNSLQIYRLSRNQFTGMIPKNICKGSSLINLDLSMNNLSGEIPSCIGTQLRALQVLDLSRNNLSGRISPSICTQPGSSLQVLDLSENNLSGEIPICMATHLSASLQVLNLLGNHFHGIIPQPFARSCKLKMINLSKNQLEGQLPKSLTHCEALEILDLGTNILNDTFPSWLGGLPNLHALVLRHNCFHGSIIAPLGVAVEDQSDSSESAFEIYTSVGNTIYTIELSNSYMITITTKGSEILFPRILNVFRVIDFSSNNFTGGIPDALGNLKGLQGLNLSNNHLIGDIPSSLANITGLEAMDLSQNMLSGEIPRQLAQLTFLEIFNVSHNHLMGAIPKGSQFDTFDNSSFVGNSGLCGGSLSMECNTDSLQPYSPTSQTSDETEDSNLIDWIVRSLGCASGFIVGMIIGKLYITDRYHDWFMETFKRRRMPKTRARRLAPRIHS